MLLLWLCAFWLPWVLWLLASVSSVALAFVAVAFGSCGFCSCLLSGFVASGAASVACGFGSIWLRWRSLKDGKRAPSKTKNKEEPIRHLYTSGRTYALAFICFGLLVQWLLTSGLGLIWFRVGF